jgi:ATP-binding cassette subfamily F protein uup
MLDDSKDLIETFCPEGGDRVNVRGRSMHVYGYLREFLFPPEYIGLIRFRLRTNQRLRFRG